MIEIERINTGNTALYAFMEDLLVKSFPQEEYRELSVLKEYTDTIPAFYNNIIHSNGEPVGFITYWDLEDFYYVEHFAIDPNQRNGGYGRKLLDYLSQKLDKPIALEVELPNEEMAQRRINFYKRQGYVLWENEYFQPPYRLGFDVLPMYLMVQGNLDSEKDFEKVKTSIHRTVYNFG